MSKSAPSQQVSCADQRDRNDANQLSFSFLQNDQQD